MNKTIHKKIQTLSVILGLQILLILFFNLYSGGSIKPTVEIANLDKVTKIIISDGATDTATLTKNQNSWQIPEAIPAASLKVAEIFNLIASLGSEWAVSSQKISQARFKVSATDFVRKITLLASDNDGEDKVVTIYIGETHTISKTYVRLSTSNNIYTTKLNIADFSAVQDDWLQTDLLAVKNIKQITGSDFKLVKAASNTEWALFNKDGMQQPPNTYNISQMLNTLNTINANGINTIVSKPSDISAKIEVITTDNKQLVFEVYKVAKPNNAEQFDYYASTSSYNKHFGINAGVFDDISQNLEQLVAEKPEEEK